MKYLIKKKKKKIIKKINKKEEKLKIAWKKLEEANMKQFMKKNKKKLIINEYHFS